MEPTDITVKILTEIRDSVRETNVRLDNQSRQLDEHSHRLDAVGDRIVEVEIRTATSIAALDGTLMEVKNLLRDRLDLRDRVDRCEHDIQLLKDRTGLR